MVLQRFTKLVPIIALLLVVSCSKDVQQEEPPIRPVRYEKVFATGGSRIRTFSGTAQAGTESRISFKVPGFIERVPVRVGDSVEKGQLIAKMDASDYELQVQQAEASLAQAQALERNAKSVYDRTQALYESRTSSKQDLDAARAAHESATAQVKAIEKRLELASLQVSYTRLVAPTKGSIASVDVDENENVQAGQPIVVLTSGNLPEVQVSVPEVLISQISTGSKVAVNFNAIPEKTFDATVTEVGVSATTFATTFPVTVRLDKPNKEIRPGMAAEVGFRFETAGTQEHLVVPAVAVNEDLEGRHVFVLEPIEDGMAITKRQDVKIGELTSEGLEILEGLQEGDLVVTAGVSKIVDGQKVKIL